MKSYIGSEIERRRTQDVPEALPKFHGFDGDTAYGEGCDFHTEVLMSGALPLAVLERKVDAWIAAKKAG